MKACYVLLIAIVCTFNLYGLERRFTLETEPLDTTDIMQRTIWDFSLRSVVSDDRGATLTLHGDSLISESLGRFRQWYFIKDASIYYAGEETPDRIVSPTGPVSWFSFPLHTGDKDASELRSIGRIYSRYDVAEQGIYGIETGTKGILILPPSDTIGRVTITKESRIVREGIDYQTKFPLTEYDSLPEISQTVIRWYLPGDTLPIALQFAREVRTSDGRQLSSIHSSYIPDLLDTETDLSYLAPDGSDPTFVRALLSSLTAEYENGNIVIRIAFNQSEDFSPLFQNGGTDLTLSIDVMDVPGNLYRHVATPLPGEGVVSIPVSNLPVGKYVIGIRSELAPEITEKRFVNIF